MKKLLMVLFAVFFIIFIVSSVDFSYAAESLKKLPTQLSQPQLQRYNPEQITQDLNVVQEISSANTVSLIDMVQNGNVLIVLSAPTSSPAWITHYGPDQAGNTIQYSSISIPDTLPNTAGMTYWNDFYVTNKNGSQNGYYINSYHLDSDTHASVNNSFGGDGKVGSHGSGDAEQNGGFYGICNTMGGNAAIYVCDPNNKRIKKFDMTGSYLGAYGSPSSNLLSYPLDVANYYDDLFIADRTTIKKVDGNFGQGGGAYALFATGMTIKAVTVNAIGSDYWVYTIEGDLIRKYNKDGVRMLSYNGSGVGNGKYQNPVSIAVHGDYVFVADAAQNKIIKYQTADK